MKKAAFPPCAESFVKVKNVFEYTQNNFRDTKWDLVRNIFNNNSVDNYKFISNTVNFRGIDYKKDMTVCVGENEYGNFVVCKIECIVINSSYTDVIFVGQKQKIIYNTFLGIYEKGDNDSDDKFHYFSNRLLLSPDPIPEVIIRGVKAYVPKYALLDPDYQS